MTSPDVGWRDACAYPPKFGGQSPQTCDETPPKTGALQSGNVRRNDVQEASEVLADLLRAHDPVPAASRRPGRPRTRTAEYFSALLDAHAQALAWFVAQHDRPPRGDRELLVAWCANAYSTEGMAANRVAGRAFDARVKTTLNLFSEARTHARTNPGKPTFSGKEKC